MRDVISFIVAILVVLAFFYSVGRPRQVEGPLEVYGFPETVYVIRDVYHLSGITDEAYVFTKIKQEI